MADNTAPTASRTAERTTVRGFDGPTMDLADMIQLELTAHHNALRSEVYASLGRLLGSKASVRSALEMMWTLLLIITTIRELSEPTTTDRDTWKEDILELAEARGGLRQRTGETIAGFFKFAAWGLQKHVGTSSFDTVHTINVIGAGVVSFARQLGTELKKAEERGVVLKDYDVEEADSDEEVMGDEVQVKEEVCNTLRVSKRKRISPSKASPSARVERSPSTAGHGNHHHGRSVSWTTSECIDILQIYRDNTNRKTVSHPRIAELHNARFWPNHGEVRTSAAVSQQYLKLVRHDVVLIPAKIVELHALLDDS